MISRIPQYFIYTALLFVFLSNTSMAGETSGILDGMTFVGNNGEKGRELDPEEYEEIVFHNGLFRSVSCDPYNFSSSEYSTTVVDNTIHFEAVTESPTHGKIAWQGIVDGDTAEVIFIWTKERWYWDIRKEYWFRGTLKE
ncbi:hypothetical protein [Neptunomonas qingdaonensis]|uniref:Uncharacterized protein n=1 Tax=Neptunomonas qingdaonensis TaxID=1045558 RepID=A0A1I2LV07_9GAMM|nr:hypothetical protein [Neptunomonas qingdaonensis]SFF83013.1 hypothetical protein SAMN05216175_101264 [Neptunomonas qingdaonensis]